MSYVVIPQRLAYQSATNPASVGNFGFISLYNDSNQYYLALHDWGQFNDGAGTSIVGFEATKRGQIGASVVQGLPVVSGTGNKPGQFSQGYVVSNPVLDIGLSGNGGNYPWTHPFPFRVLAPGWRLTAYATTVNVEVTLWLTWQVVLPDEILNPNIGDPAIDKGQV